MRRKGILVLGMHRSGTSALAGLLTKVGVAGPSRPMAASQYNEKGYFESRVICGMMDRLLAAAGSSWDDWRRLDLQALPPETLAAAKAELVNAVREEFGEAPVFVVKDPRNARAVPLWLDILRALDTEPYAIITIRPPQAVTRSLALRDKMPGDKAALLWIRHVLDAERFTRAIPRAFMGFDELLGAPAAALERVAETLGIAWPVPPSEAADELTEFAEPSLVHHAAGDDGAPGAAASARWYEPLMALLTASAQSPSQAVDTAAFDALEERFTHETAPFAHYFGVAEAALRDRERMIGELRQSLAETRKALDAAAAVQRQTGLLRDSTEDVAGSQGEQLDGPEIS